MSGHASVGDTPKDGNYEVDYEGMSPGYKRVPLGATGGGT